MRRVLLPFLALSLLSAAQRDLRKRDGPESAAPGFRLPAGTHIPVTFLSPVSTSRSSPGDPVYLQTAFPVLAAGSIVIPAGSFLEGNVTELRRPGRLKRRADLFLRVTLLTLPSGARREMRAELGSSAAESGAVLRPADRHLQGSRKAIPMSPQASIALPFTRGPDVKLERGSTVDLVLQDPLEFTYAGSAASVR